MWNVPKEILKVKRPTGTIVQDNGGNGPLRYAVRARKESVRKNGRTLTMTGRTVGHIVGGEFVPRQEKLAESGPVFLEYGGAALVHKHSVDIYENFLEIYRVEDVFTIMTLVTLRIVYPGIPVSRLARKYKSSFVSVQYPGVALSENTISKFLFNLGSDQEKSRAFFKKRLDEISEKHHIVIDGTLVQDTSRVNSLSHFSYKARVKGCRDISVIYAYDVETMEPLCAKVYPGNCNDCSAYRDFIRENGITKGVVVTDKGFPFSKVAEEFEKHSGLHHITPLRRNSKKIETYGLTEPDDILRGVEKRVLFKKCHTRNGTFLYAYQDVDREAREKRSFVDHTLRKEDDFDKEAYLRKSPRYGLIVFESDLDLPADVVYRCYEDRWQLEMIFAAYKGDLEMDNTRVHEDFSVRGNEFINFISTLITSRIIREKKNGVLSHYTYGEMMDELRCTWRKKDAKNHPSSADDCWENRDFLDFELLENLGLSEKAEEPKKAKRGRPRKNAVRQGGAQREGVKEAGGDGSAEDTKHDLGAEKSSEQPSATDPTKATDGSVAKRKRGRPRIHPLKDPNAPKRPRGRPRKHSVEEPKVPEGPQGKE